MDAIVHILIYLVVAGIIFGLLFYLLSIAPIPEPFKGWIWFVLMALIVVFIIYFLLNLIGPMPSINLGSGGHR